MHHENDDRTAIEELLYSYARHFDLNEPEQLVELFTEDVVIDYGPEMEMIRGRKDILKVIKSGLDEVFAATSHHISNVSVSFEDDSRAVCDAYVYAWHRYHSGAPDGYLWGRYHCAFSRSGTGWLISSLTLRAAGTTDFHRKEMHPIGRRSTPRGVGEGSLP